MTKTSLATIEIDETPLPVVIDGEGQSTTAFTDRDAGDLETYFRSNLPPAYGASSLVGAMMARLGESTNQKTDELPSGPEEEWIQCESSQGHGDPSSVEDAFIRYIEQRGRVKRAHRVLARLPQKHVDVLEARYALPAPTTEHSAARQRLGSFWEVAQLVAIAGSIRAAAEAETEGKTSSRRDALVRLVHQAGSKDPKAAEAREQVRVALVQARAVVAEAEAAYALMSRWVRGS
jgi:hypothetical protein